MSTVDRLQAFAIFPAIVGVVATLALIAGAARTAPAEASATVTVSTERVPVSIVPFVPCALGGAGEAVLLEGNLLIVFRAVSDGNGGFHISSHFSPQGISGTGLISGDRYQGTGVTRDNFNTNGGLPSEATFVNNFRIIGEGTGNNLLVHATIHTTVNANGVVTAEVLNSSIDCK